MRCLAPGYTRCQVTANIHCIHCCKQNNYYNAGKCFCFVVELPENWGEIEERVEDGVTFHLKYLGSILVEELENDDDSYGDNISAEAIRVIVAMVSR